MPHSPLMPLHTAIKPPANEPSNQQQSHSKSGELGMRSPQAVDNNFVHNYRKCKERNKQIKG